MDGHGEVNEDGEEEAGSHHEDVRAGALEHGFDEVEFAHVVGNDGNDTAEGGHGDEGGIASEEEHDDQEEDGVEDAGDGRLAAVLDVRCGSGDGACCGDTTEEGREDVGNAFTDEFGIGVVAAANHTIGNNGREEGFNTCQEGNGDGGRNEFANGVPLNGGQGGEGEAHTLGHGGEFAADGGHGKAELLQDHGQDGGDNNGDNGAGHLLGNPLPIDTDGNGEQGERNGGPVDGV